MIGEERTLRNPTVLADVGTVVWKEMRELRQGAPNTRIGRGGLTQPLLMIAVVGILLPSSFGREWVTSPSTLLYWAWVPMLLISSVVAQSFAGERELHTLESLLATRLSDRSILLGKIVAAVVYGWGITLVSLVLGLVVTNIRFRGGGLIIYSPGMAISIVLLTLLVSLLAASLGVLVSLRARTARQAQQTLGIASAALLMGGVYGIRALPIEWAAVIGPVGTSAWPAPVVWIAAGALLVIDAALVAAGMLRFQRARLISD